MRDEFRLFFAVARAALVATVGYAAMGALTVILGDPGSKLVLSRRVQDIIGTIIGLLLIAIPVWIATRWMFRTLQAHFTKREARAVTTAFAVLSPVWFGIAILLGELGGYAETLLGHFAVVGVFAVVLSIATLVSFMFCLIVLRVTRLTIQVESTYP